MYVSGSLSGSKQSPCSSEARPLGTSRGNTDEPKHVGGSLAAELMLNVCVWSALVPPTLAARYVNESVSPLAAVVAT